MTHHKTWFPVILVALTLLLGTFIYSVFRERAGISVESSPVTAVEYQARVHVSVSGLSVKLASAASNDDRAVTLSQVREELLALFVPAEYKDLHLEMVMTLTQWIAGYEGQSEKISAAQGRWQLLVDQYPWIE